MGCLQSKNKGKAETSESAVGEANKAESPAGNSGAADHPEGRSHPSGGSRSPSNGAHNLHVTSSEILEILKALEASAEQTQFFEAWANHIFDPAPKTASRSVSLTTDGSVLDVCVSDDAKTMCALAKDFVQRTGIPDTMLVDMEEAQTEIRSDFVGLWCKIKLRSNLIDAGFHLNGSIPWPVADLLMPSGDDSDAIRDYANQEGQIPSTYSCSLFPREPEKSLRFILNESDQSNSRRSLLAAFFFFKSLGFAKPEDSVVRLLSSCGAGKIGVVVTMGPQGLTRLAVTMCEPSKMIAKELAEALEFQFISEKIERIKAALHANVDMVEYAADAKGYVVAVGFNSWF